MAIFGRRRRVGLTTGSREPQFAMEDALWTEFAYAPYVPAGVPVPAYPGHRRVIGRRGRDVVSITDLPAHWRLLSDPLGAYGHQHFSYARDFVAWIRESCRGTRFVEPSPLRAAERLAIAVAAVRTGLAWDLDNVMVNDPEHTPLGTDWELGEYRLVATDFDAWSIVNVETEQYLSQDEGEEVLTRLLHDVAPGDDVFVFQTRRNLP